MGIWDQYFLAILSLFVFKSPERLTASCNYSYPGDGGTISLLSGDSVCIPNGSTFAGIVSSFPNGSKITVQEGASFQPSSMPTSAGLLQNKGTTLLPNISLGSGFELVNEDTLSFDGSLTLGGGINIDNQDEGRLTFVGTLNLNAASTLDNTGIIYTLSDALFSSSFTNNGYILGLSSIDLDGTLNNFGLISAQGPISLGGSSTMNNSCTLISIEGFVNDNANTQNQGVILVQGTNGFPNDLIEINQTFNNHSQGYVAGVRFENNATITGSGNFYFSGQTENNGPFGADANGINFYDASSPVNIMDVESVVPDGTVIRNISLIPDSFFIPSGCDVRFFPAFLPVEWQDISVGLEGGDGVLRWSTSEEINHDRFEVERAIDGKSFSKISEVKDSERIEGNSKYYEYRDPQITFNDQGNIYYRIKQVDVDGNASFSQVMILSFTDLQNQTSFFVGNPIVDGQLSFTLETAEPIKGSLEVLDLNGRLVQRWEVDVSRGRNARTLNLSATPRGMVLVRLRAKGEIFQRKVMMLSR